MKKRTLALLLCFALLLPLCGCRKTIPTVNAVDLMASFPAGDGEARASDPAFARASANVAVGLLQGSAKGTENCVLSPYSAMVALAMTANGAQGATLAQMEAVLGLPVGDLNAYLHGCDLGNEAVSANSIWVHSMPDFVVKEDFLQTNADYYDADVYSAPFDEQTVEDINVWVNAHTAGRIPRMLSQIDPLARLILVNALTFDAQWEEKYIEGSATKDEFHAADGTVQEAEYLHSEEWGYLDDGMATGFRKPYEGGRYSYVALLPNEGVTMEDYLDSLTGEALLDTLNHASEESVNVKMPKLQTETTLELNGTLRAMGMPFAFDFAQADFSAMSDSSLHIGTALQKTWLEVDEKGTKAAAATAVMMDYTSAIMEDLKSVCLDRPFVMGIFDSETQTFLFLGVINQVQE